MVQQLLGPLLHQLGPAVVEACGSAAQQAVLQQDDDDDYDDRDIVLDKFHLLLKQQQPGEDFSPAVKEDFCSLVECLVTAGEWASCAHAVAIAVSILQLRLVQPQCLCYVSAFAAGCRA
jgi:hypothetical protein